MLIKNNFYIDGAWVTPCSTNTLDVINPSTAEAFATITLGNTDDTNAAVAAAKRALPLWKKVTVNERVALLEKLLGIYQSRLQEMGEIISTEMGAPIKMAVSSQAAAGESHLQQTIKTLELFNFEKKLQNGERLDTIFYEPIGVVGLITPWNWPMNQVLLKVAPALAAGCTMVLKPSEISPLSSMLLAEMIDEIGLPAGVFNLVNGDGVGVGSDLSQHPDISMISFTGSTRAGKIIMKTAASDIKRISLELGGKGANIIFADADENAVVRGVKHCFNNSGQSCNAPTRMLVEQSFYDKAVDIAIATAKNTAVNLANEEGKHIGPVSSDVQFNKVQALIQKGIDEGANLAWGGVGRPEGLGNGYFVKPTIFTDVSPDMLIFKEEIFGPVLCIMPFSSEEEAINLANDTPYGLTNYVQTSDVNRITRMVRQLNSGMVEVNGVSRGSEAPFVGRGLSGNGREGGQWGLEEYLDVKAVSGIV